MKDLGLRAKQIRWSINQLEHPVLKYLLKRDYKLSSSLGLTDVVLNNTLGANLRYAFTVIHDLKLRFYRRDIVGTALYFTLCQHGEHTCATILRKTGRLNVNRKLLAKIDRFIESIDHLLKEEPLSPELVELESRS